MEREDPSGFIQRAEPRAMSAIQTGWSDRRRFPTDSLVWNPCEPREPRNVRNEIGLRVTLRKSSARNAQNGREHKDFMRKREVEDIRLPS